MEKDLDTYNSDKLQLSKQRIQEEKDKMPYYFSLQPHEQNFLDKIVFEGRDLIRAYNEAFADINGFEMIKTKRKALNLVKRVSVQNAFTELSKVKLNLLVSRMTGYYVDSMENIVNIATFSENEKIKLDANKYIADTYLKSLKELVSDAESQSMQININNSGGGKIAVINVKASDMSEQHRVFDGKSAQQVKNKITGDRAVVIEHVDNDD